MSLPEIDGFENKVRGTFIKCAKGKFLIKDEENGDFIVTDTEGKSRKYRSSNCLKGIHLTDIKFKEDKSGKGYGHQFQFEFITQKSNVLILMLGFESLIAQGLLNSFASIEEFGTLELTSSMKEERTSIWVENNNQKVMWKWKLKRDDPDSPIPDGDPVILKNGQQKLNKLGKPEFDYSVKMQWFMDVVIPGILEKVQQSFAGRSAMGVQTYSEEEME